MSQRSEHGWAGAAWAGFVVILLHNLEEALTAPNWLALHAHELQLRFGLERLPAADRRMFYTGLTVLTVVILLWIAVASRARSRSLGVYSVAFLFFVFLCNAMAPHLIGALLLRQYVPGVLTAVTLVIPFTTWWSIQSLRKGWVDWRGLLAALAAAIVFYIPALGFLVGRLV